MEMNDMRTLIKPMRVVDMSGRVIEIRQVPRNSLSNLLQVGVKMTEKLFEEQWHRIAKRFG